MRVDAKKGFLVGDYSTHDEFADVVRPHLLLLLGKMFSSQRTALDAAQRAGQYTATADLSAVRAQVLALGKEYEQTRRSMRSGDARTRAMEVIASRMRSLALPAYPLLAELTASESTGQRLAAISILETIPTPEYLSWLADRLSVEKPFWGIMQASRCYKLHGIYGLHMQRMFMRPLYERRRIFCNLSGKIPSKSRFSNVPKWSSIGPNRRRRTDALTARGVLRPGLRHRAEHSGRTLS